MFVPHSEIDLKKMFEELSISSLDDLFTHIPETLKLNDGLNVPVTLSELESIAHFESVESKNKQNLIFTTDRAWIRSRDQFVDIIKSYQNIDGESQTYKYNQLLGENKEQTYGNCFKEFSEVYQMGRFSLFIYLDVIHHVTGYPIEPDGIDLKYAESSRNGLCYAIDREDLITHKGNKKLTQQELNYLQFML